VHQLKWRYNYHEYLEQAVKIGRFAPIDPILELMRDDTISDPKSYYECVSTTKSPLPKLKRNSKESGFD
jgi:hypothetical protein